MRNAGAGRCALSLFNQVGPRHPCRWFQLPASKQPTDLDAVALANLLQDA